DTSSASAVPRRYAAQRRISSGRSSAPRPDSAATTSAAAIARAQVGASGGSSFFKRRVMSASATESMVSDSTRPAAQSAASSPSNGPMPCVPKRRDSVLRPGPADDPPAGRALLEREGMDRSGLHDRLALLFERVVGLEDGVRPVAGDVDVLRPSE